jgi:hypothetical protein
MTMRVLVALAGMLTLCGCSSSQQVWVSQPQSSYFAWDGLGRDPNLPAIKRSRRMPEQAKKSADDYDSDEAELAGLREYSREWVVARKALDAKEDARLAKVLVICRGCDPPSRDSRPPGPSDRANLTLSHYPQP